MFDDVSKSKKYNESMLSSMSNGVITINEEDEIVTCNKSGLKILRVISPNIVGLKSESFFKEKNSWIQDKINIV